MTGGTEIGVGRSVCQDQEVGGLGDISCADSLKVKYFFLNFYLKYLQPANMEGYGKGGIQQCLGIVVILRMMLFLRVTSSCLLLI